MEKRVSWQCPHLKKVLLRELLCSLSQPGSIKPSRTRKEPVKLLVNLVQTIMTLIAQMMIAAMKIVIQTDYYFRLYFYSK